MECLTSTIIDVTSKMLPSFRILAFYLLPKGTGQTLNWWLDPILIDVNDNAREKVSSNFPVVHRHHNSWEIVCTKSRLSVCVQGRGRGSDVALKTQPQR